MRQAKYNEIDPVAVSFAEKHGIDVDTLGMPDVHAVDILNAYLTREDAPTPEQTKIRQLRQAWTNICRAKGWRS